MSSDEPSSSGHEFVTRIVIARPRHELYAFWRNFTNAPKFMAQVDTVTEVDALSSMWTVKDAGGKSAQWEMLVTEDEPDRLIAWSTSGNSPVTYSGRVEFHDVSDTEGTQVTASVRHIEQPGLVETIIEAVAGNPAEHDPPIQSRSDLDRLKQYMESAATRTA